MHFSASGRTVAVRTAVLAFVALAPFQELHAASLVLTDATVLTPSALTKPENEAIQLLVDEIRKRTTIGLPVDHRWLDGDKPLLVIATVDHLPAFELPAELQKLIPTPPEPNEAFAISVKMVKRRQIVFVIGRDARGFLFGIGHLLRQLRMTLGAVETPAGLSVSTAPSVALRGHQLGYRPKTNSYDGWDVADWEQYTRDLIVFGLNAIELVPPRSDDAATSPHFPRPQIDMMIEMSRIADDYGLDCWVWYPALDKDYDDPATVQKALDEWEEVFRRLPRIDAVLVPGGDPGHTPPRPLMKLLERQSVGLRRHHPRRNVGQPARFQLGMAGGMVGPCT